MGLFIALELVNKGFNNIEIVSKEFEYSASFNAGGLFAPSTMDNTDDFAPLLDQFILQSRF